MKKTIKKLLSTLAAMLFVVSAYAQFTTSSMNGRVADESGEALVGAAVVAVHTPSGSQYYAIANESGYYTIQGMRPGGPYEVTVSLVGCQTVRYQDITLALGETYQVDAVLKTDSELLDEVVVVASTSKFSAEKTGASTNISNRAMMNLPNADRSIESLTKLSPYSNGIGFAGADGRSTNFTVDGANFNNNFGLDFKLPGGGTPISIDALDEIQLVVAPYDVRQSNFVGGGINAITKSGTNTFKGTAYTYLNNQDFIGHRVNGKDIGKVDEKNLTLGATIGGPIIKNKLFFFVNFEWVRIPGQTIQYQADPAKQAVLQQIADKLKNDYGYDPGSYTDYPGGTNNMKILARIDWNINDAHKLSVRFNQTDNTIWYEPNGNSCDDNFRNRSYNRASEASQPFSSNLWSDKNKVLSFTTELNSRFTDKISNRFLVAYTYNNAQRGSASNGAFPHIDIMTDGDISSGNYIPYTSLGYELFAWNNGIKTDNLNIQDNVTIYAGAHTIVAGASYEMMKSSNSYMRSGTGYYRYASAEDFLEGNLPLSFCLSYGYDGDENPAGIVKYNQGALYVQDEWKINKKFKLTYGLRGDLIAFDNSALKTNAKIAAIDYGGKTLDTGLWPKARFQVSPRIGFNWDIFGDKSLVMRGGTGIFQGRLPLVFFTNMPQNSGMIQGSAGKTYSAKLVDGELVYSADAREGLLKLNGGVERGGKFMTNVQDIVKTLGLPTSPSESSAGKGSNAYIGGVDRDFHMPQTWKTSIAFDYRVPTSFPFTITAEGMFNKTIWGVCMQDWSVNDSKLTSTFSGPDKRVNYNDCSDYRYDETNAYVMTNTQKGWGYTANITVNMEPVRNLDLMFAYTRTESKEVCSMPGSDGSAIFTGVPTVSGVNLSGLQRSRYVIPDKIMANVSYFIPWEVFHGKGLNINAYYTAYSPTANSYIYSNDMNGDGNAVDLLYIPASKDELNFVTPADADAFWNFVNSDSYLKSHKGQYAEAYSASSPWVHRIDLRIAEDFAFRIGKNLHNIQVSISFDNIGNMFDSSFGVRKMSCYQTSLDDMSGVIAPLKYEGVNERNEPIFSMNKVDGAYPTQNYTKYYENTSECWRILFGIKYSFN